MAIALLIIGLILIVTAIRGTHGQLWTMVTNDLTGVGASHGFLVWAAAIIAIGALGFYKPIRGPSHLLLALVVLAIFISNQGVFSKIAQTFTSGIPQTPAPADATQQALPPAIPVDVGGTGSGSGGGGVMGQIGQALGIGKALIGLF